MKNPYSSEGSQTSGPVYDELQRDSTPEYQDMNELDLEENISHGPIA